MPTAEREQPRHLRGSVWAGRRARRVPTWKRGVGDSDAEQTPSPDEHAAPSPDAAPRARRLSHGDGGDADGGRVTVREAHWVCALRTRAYGGLEPARLFLRQPPQLAITRQKSLWALIILYSQFPMHVFWQALAGHDFYSSLSESSSLSDSPDSSLAVASPARKAIHQGEG
jgi:hypothetical protein